MAIEKLLHKIKDQIGDLHKTMESFSDDTIQPSAEDCENLRKQMNDLLECVAVYKHYKFNKEISPSFQIHAKISEVAAAEKVVKESLPVKEVEISQPAISESKKEKKESPSKNALMIGINDKFRFINELFSQNNPEYNIVLEQLNNLNTWPETEIYLSSLKNVYGWKDHNETVKYFYSLVKKRFQ